LRSSTFFLKFKEENGFNYRKIVNILNNLKFDHIIYFDEINFLAEEFLHQYSLLERQIIIKNLISENYSQLEITFEIFSKFWGEKNDPLLLNKTTLDVLDLIKKSEGCLELY